MLMQSHPLLLEQNHWPWQEISSGCELCVVRYEISDIKSLLGDIFERNFGEPPPDYPAHYVLFIRQAGMISVLGYMHGIDTLRYSLGGGMCMDTRVLRRMNRDARLALARIGGGAQFLLHGYVELLQDKEALFSNTTHATSVKIQLNEGFRLTRHDQIFVRWNKGVPSDADALINEVHALGSF